MKGEWSVCTTFSETRLLILLLYFIMQSKCYQYWPSVDEEEAHGPYTITTIQQSDHHGFTVRTLTIEVGDETRQLKQYHFTQWLDHTVPQDPTELLTMMTEMQNNHDMANEKDQKKPPIVVHCRHDSTSYSSI